MGAHCTHTHDHTSSVPCACPGLAPRHTCSVARRSVRESRFYISRFKEPYTLLAFFLSSSESVSCLGWVVGLSLAPSPLSPVSAGLAASFTPCHLSLSVLRLSRAARRARERERGPRRDTHREVPSHCHTAGTRLKGGPCVQCIVLSRGKLVTRHPRLPPPRRPPRARPPSWARWGRARHSVAARR